MARERHSRFEEEQGPAGDGGPGEAANFVADSVRELSLLARRHRLDTLAFLLDMAQMEADELARTSASGKRRSRGRSPDT